MQFRLRSLAVPLVAAALLAGCARPGTAAIVEDTYLVTDDQVAALAADLGRLQGTQTTAQSALQSLVMVEPVLELADDAGIGVTDQQAVELLDGIVAQAGGEAWEYSAELIDVARMNVAAQEMDETLSAEVNELILNMSVEVNPRFGSWDPATGITATSWSWLAS